MTRTEAGFQARLDADPGDSLARLVLADHLDEIGDERAAGYRALGLLGLWPERRQVFVRWNIDALGRGRTPPGYLPVAWYERLVGRSIWEGVRPNPRRYYRPDMAREYGSRVSAEDDAARAWGGLSESDRAAILAPVLVENKT